MRCACKTAGAGRGCGKAKGGPLLGSIIQQAVGQTDIGTATLLIHANSSSILPSDTKRLQFTYTTKPGLYHNGEAASGLPHPTTSEKTGDRQSHQHQQNRGQNFHPLNPRQRLEQDPRQDDITLLIRHGLDSGRQSNTWEMRVG
jgi:hypothetical protein